MDAAGIATFLLAAQRQNTQMAIVTAVAKQQQQMQDNVLKLLEGGLQSAAEFQAAAPSGTGTMVDVTV